MTDSATLLSADERIAITHEMIARYNAQDADAYVAFHDRRCLRGGLSGYGHPRRQGRHVRRLKAMFAQYPQNRAEIVGSWCLGETVVLHEKVARAPDGDRFEVMSIYTFEGDKVSRVEFIR